MYSNICSSEIIGVTAIPVTVETDITNGLPTFTMVGSLSSEVKESKDRVISALKNAGIRIPSARITVNIAPSNLRKEGNYYDLPIAVGILVSSGEVLPSATENILFIGELGLDGEVKPVNGVLPIVSKAKECGIKECIVPYDNAREGSVVPGINVRGAYSINQVRSYLQTADEALMPICITDTSALFEEKKVDYEIDFDQIMSQEGAKRAALIAAAGFHSLMLSGPPGVGKSMIAKRIPTIMPPITLDESLELTAIHSIAGKLPRGEALLTTRSFQSPHHSASIASLIGGGYPPSPGAVSLAHRSVLFLDEFTEFDRRTIDSLRQPIENRMVSISRARYSVTYPSDFLLVCAMNPCPCGYYPDRNRCSCTLPELKRYIGKISGPILDRIDLFASLKPLGIDEISLGNVHRKKDKDNDKKNNKKSITSSKEMRFKITTARKIQNERYSGTSIRFNSDLQGSDLPKYCHLGRLESDYMDEVYVKLGLSARSYHRIIRVARTVADLEESEQITIEHLLEATGYRPDFTYEL